MMMYHIVIAKVRFLGLCPHVFEAQPSEHVTKTSLGAPEYEWSPEVRQARR